MAETIREAVEDIKIKLSPLNILDERAVETGIVERLLKIAGWDTTNTVSEVVHAAHGESAVDYRLRLNGSDEVFIEVKNGSEDLREHTAQLMGYCETSTEVKLSVLTNGRKWWFYLPSKKDAWKDPWKFCTINIESARADDVQTKFLRFLSRDRVASDEAIKTATIVSGRQRNAEIRKSAICKAWNQIVTTPDETFLGLIADQTLTNLTKKERIKKSNLVGLIKDFLKEHSQFVVECAHQHEQTSNDNPVDLTGKKPRSLVFQGKERKVSGWPQVHSVLCELIYNDHPNDFDSVLDADLQGREKTYFSKNPGGMRKPEQIASSEVFRETYQLGGSVGTMTICRKMLKKFGYEDKSLEIEVEIRNTKQRRSLYYP